MPLDPTTREPLLAAIPEAAAQERKALEDWDASDSLSDDNHEPPGKRYDVRQRLRVAESWAAFEPFLDHGPELLAQAEEDFRALHQGYEKPDFEAIDRRRTQLTTLHYAIAGGRQQPDVWDCTDEMALLGHPKSAEIRRRFKDSAQRLRVALRDRLRRQRRRPGRDRPSDTRTVGYRSRPHS